MHTQPHNIGTTSILILRWPDEGYTAKKQQNGIPTNPGVYASLSHAFHHSATQPLTACPQEPLRYLKEALMSPLLSCLPGASLSRLTILSPSSPKYIVSASPSLRANPSDSPAPTFHLVYALLQGGAYDLSQHSYWPAQSTFYPLIQWDRIKFLLVHILCLGWTQIHMYFVVWYFLLLSHGFQSFAFAIVCLALYIHF